jgi:outer membrane murein-binding lipoprotein Lpp
MSKAKKTSSKNKIKKTTDKASDVAKNIWLAGLGAYGKAYDDAISRVEQAGKDVPKLFEDLVKKGAHIEADSSAPTENPLEKARTDIEERIAKMRENLGFGKIAGGGEELSKLEAKVDALTKKVASLSKEVTSLKKGPTKAAPKVKASVTPKAKAKVKAKSKAAPKAKTKAKAKPKKKAK